MNKPRHRSFFEWCKRYISLNLIGIVAALVWILFFTDNSVSVMYAYDREIDSLEQAIKICNDSADYYHQLNGKLQTEQSTMEQVVREQYHMQRPYEDVYVISK